MKKRERRRYLTQKYQQKQVRLANQLRGYRPYDSQRYIQRPLALKRRFYDLLAGNIVGIAWNDWERNYRFRDMIGHDTDRFTQEQLGRLRNHSWDDCGRPRCHHCSNPRRGWTWDSWKERVTMQERISAMSMKDDLEYYYQYEEKSND